MKILNKLTIRTMIQHKKRTFLTLLGIILSSMLLFSIALAGATYRENKILEAKDFYGEQHAIIYNADLKNKSILDENENVESYYYLFEDSKVKVEQKLENVDYTTSRDITIYSIPNTFSLDIGLIGELPKNNQEIVLNRDNADFLGAHINDKVILQDKEYTVVGIYKYSYVLNNIDSNMAFTKSEEKEARAIYFVNMKSYKDIYNNLDSLKNSMERTYTNPTPEQLLDNVKMEINNNLLENYTIIPDKGAVGQSITILVLMFLMLVMGFVVLFVIYNAFAIAVNERKKTYGMYKSIGATPRQIVSSVMLEALILTLIAIPIGFLLSMGFVSSILAIFNHLLLDIIDHPFIFSIYPMFIIIAIFYIIACVFIASFSPAKRASEASPIETIRQNTEITKKGALFKENKLVRKLFGIEGVISSKNSTRNHRKYNVTVFSIVIGCILFIVSSIFLNMYTYATKLSLGVGEDTIIVTLAPNEKEKIENIAMLEEIDKYVYYSYVPLLRLEFQEEDILKTPVSQIVNNFSNVLYVDNTTYEQIKKEYKLINDYPMVVGTYDVPLSTTANITIGRSKYDYFNKNIVSVKVYKNNYPSNTKQYLAEYSQVNVIHDFGKKLKTEFDFDSSNQPVLILPYPEKTDFMEHITIKMKSKEYRELDSKIKPIIADSEYQYDDNYINAPLKNYANNQKMIAIKIVIYSAIILIAIITVTSIINTISTNLELRRREFAVLRSIGLNQKGFYKMILYESLMLSMKALIFGILLSIATLVIFLLLFSLDGLIIQEVFYLFPRSTYILPFIICIFVVFLLVFSSFYIATRKFKNDNIADILKEDAF